MRSEPDERAREMYRLRTVEGLTLRQLAERFQVSPERVRQLVYAYARVAGCERSTRRDQPSSYCGQARKGSGAHREPCRGVARRVAGRR